MDFEDFGRYLSQQRELRGLSRDEVAKVTKIPPALITALESGHMDRLPGRVFVLNYVRAYAHVIGIEPEEAVLRFEEVDKTVQGVTPVQVLERERKKQALVTLLGVVIALAVVGYLALIWAGFAPNPLQMK